MTDIYALPTTTQRLLAVAEIIERKPHRASIGIDPVIARPLTEDPPGDDDGEDPTW